MRSTDENQPFSKIQHHENFRTCAVDSRYGLEVWCMEDSKIRFKIVLFIQRGIYEHILGKEAMPCLFRYNPHLNSVFRVSACVAILHKHFLVLKICQQAIAHSIEMFGGNFVVDRAPPDISRVLRFVDDILVFWRPSSVFASGYNQSAAGCQLALAAPKRMLIKLGHGKIPMSDT